MRFMAALLVLMAGCASTPGGDADVGSARTSWQGAY